MQDSRGKARKRIAGAKAVGRELQRQPLLKSSAAREQLEPRDHTRGDERRLATAACADDGNEWVRRDSGDERVDLALASEEDRRIGSRECTESRERRSLPGLGQGDTRAAGVRLLENARDQALEVVLKTFAEITGDVVPRIPADRRAREKLFDFLVLQSTVVEVWCVGIQHHRLRPPVEQHVRRAVVAEGADRILKLPLRTRLVAATVRPHIGLRQRRSHTRPEDHNHDVALAGQSEPRGDGVLRCHAGKNRGTRSPLVPRHVLDRDPPAQERIVRKVSEHRECDFSLISTSPGDARKIRKCRGAELMAKLKRFCWSPSIREGSRRA